MPVKPIAPRYSFEDKGNKLYISIPSRKNWLLISFLGICHIGLAVDVVGISWIAFFDKHSESVLVPVLSLFFILWMIGIAFAVYALFWRVEVFRYIVRSGGIGTFATYAFLWQIAGREEIEVTSHSIAVSQVALTFRKSKEYLSERIMNLRTLLVDINEMHKWSHYRTMFGIGGVIAFDYDAETIRFGSGIDEAEGKQIVAEIKKKFPVIGGEQ